MPGPPISGPRSPPTARPRSRTTSASTRNRFWRPSRTLPGSRPASSARGRDDCRYVAEVTIVRIKTLRLQPEAMNSVASQSSNSGCDGGSPWSPKFSVVATSPRPKRDCHSALTATLAVSGFAGSISHRPRSYRSGSPRRPRSGGKKAGVPGRTSSPGERKSPRNWTKLLRGRGFSATVSARELGAGGRLFASISLSSTADRSRAYSGSIARK